MMKRREREEVQVLVVQEDGRKGLGWAYKGNKNLENDVYVLG